MAACAFSLTTGADAFEEDATVQRARGCTDGDLEVEVEVGGRPELVRDPGVLL